MTEPFPDRIETDRLQLERLSSETVDPLAYYEICAADTAIEEVTEYVPWEPHATPKETLAFLESRDDAWERGRSAEYVVRPGPGEPDAGEIAGAAGLVVDWDRRTGELGVWLRKRFWGRGYSGERADALVTLAFDEVALELVTVPVRADNEKSLRAVERYVERHDGRRDGRFRNWRAADDPVDVVRFSIARTRYDGENR